MITKEIRKILTERASVNENWDFAIQQCWEKEIELLSQNIEETIAFLENDCTADEFSWLSEIFDDVAETTQSEAFINALYDVAKKYPEETKKYNILHFIESAQALIDK